MICAACTSRHAVVTTHGDHPCDHDSSHVLAPLARQDLSIPDDTPAERAPRVDIVTLCHLWEEGRTMALRAWNPARAWSPTLDHLSAAVDAVSDPWGGVTIGPEGPVSPSSGYAVAVRKPLESSAVYHVGEKIGLPEVVLAPYLGVFRDEVSGLVEVDPVAIVPTLRHAQALSVFCRSTGGAYDFSTGNGWWTPTL
jgi:hypothetical protein